MSKKVASIFDRSDNDDGSDHEQRQGQAYFAGGSEHSGQQILGPEREGNLVENLLRDARRHAEETTAPSEGMLPVTFWRNGFTVGEDSELRDYESNREFLSYLRRGEMPPELAAQVRGGLVDVKLDNKAHQDYEPGQGRTPVFKGEGHRLGAPTPSMVADQASQSSSEASTDTPSSKPSMDAIRQARLARFGQKPKKEQE